MKKYVLVGASQRCMNMFARPMVKKFGDVAKIAGLYDVNRVRAEYFCECIDPDIPIYNDFDEMMKIVSPDVVIIATTDRWHHEYIIRSLEYGCDVITEKPITIDEEKCNAILEAEKKSGRKVTVTFNCRFMPYIARIKELIKDGAVGKILSINYEYFLDTNHGADYFRRWHRRRENSGGLLVHKSTHHFDVINWWLCDYPETIFAIGNLGFYGPTRKNKGIRCSTCNYHKGCEYYVHLQSDPFYDNMYFKAEKEDGYFRDSCVFSDEIDVEDTMSVTVRYSKGTILTYSLAGYSPYEGWKAVINGIEGRLEVESNYSGDKAENRSEIIKLYNRTGESITYNIPKSAGEHSGGDIKLQQMIFTDGLPDPLGQFSGAEDGVLSAMVGICANKSIKENKPYLIRDLLSDQNWKRCISKFV